MAFPTNSTVLDSFDRGDEVPLGSPWSTTNLAGGSTNRLRVSTNQVAGESSGAYNSQWWNSTTYGPDTEVYVAVPTWEPDLLQLYLRVQSPGSAGIDGYVARLNLEGTNVMRIYRLTDNSETQLAETTGITFASGDSFGFEAVGNILTAYRKPAAGSWGSIVTYDITPDGTKYTTAGYVGLEIYGNTTRCDSFSGGTVVAGLAKAGTGIIGP